MLAAIGENLFENEYVKSLEEYLTTDVRENCDARFSGIDKRTAPKIFVGEEANVVNGEPYAEHVKKYGSRITEELSRVRPAVDSAKHNFEERTEIEWKSAVKRQKIYGRLRGGMLPVISLVGIILVALMCVAAGNNFKKFPYLDITLIATLIGFCVVYLFGSFMMSLYWLYIDRKRKKAGELTGLMKAGAIIRTIIIIYFIGFVVATIYLGTSLPELGGGELLSLFNDSEVMLVAGLTGLSVGAAIALLILSVYKAIGISRSVGRENPVHATGSTRVSMKKYGKVSVIVIPLLIVVLCVVNLLAQMKIVDMAGNISYISFMMNDDVIITGIDLDYFKDNPEGYLPATIDGKAVTALTNGWIEENDIVKNLNVDSAIEIAEGALEPMRGLESLTFAATKPINSYFGGSVPSSLNQITIVRNPDTGDSLDLTSDFFAGCENVETIELINTNISSIDSDAFDGNPQWLDSFESREENGILYFTVGDTEIALKANPIADSIIIDLSNAAVTAKGILNSLDGEREVSLTLSDSMTSDVNTTEKAAVINVLGDSSALANVTSLTVEEYYPEYNFGNFTNLRSVNIIGLSTSTETFKFSDVFPATVGNIEYVQLVSGDYGEGSFDGLTGVKSIFVDDANFAGNLFSSESSHRFALLFSGNNSGIYSFTAGNAVSIFNARNAFNIDGNYYKIDSNSDGAMLLYFDDSTGNTDVNEYVAYEGQQYAITEIATTAFRDSSVTELVLPDTLRSLHTGMLIGCDKLVSLTVPFLGSEENTSPRKLGFLFNYSSSDEEIPETLRSVTVNGGIITDGAFEACTGLQEITLGAGITDIYADIILDSGVTTLNYNAANAEFAYIVDDNYFGNGTTPLNVNFGENIGSLPDVPGVGVFRTSLIGDITAANADLYTFLAANGETHFDKRLIGGKIYNYKTPNDTGCVHESGDFWWFTETGETKVFSINPDDYEDGEDIYCPVCGEFIMNVIPHEHTYVYTDIALDGEYISAIRTCDCGERENVNIFNITVTSVNGSDSWDVEYDEGIKFTSSIHGLNSRNATITLTALTDVTVDFDYTVSSEGSFDKFYAYKESENDGRSILIDGYSGDMNGSVDRTQLLVGESLEFIYAKDGSQHSGNDEATVTLSLGA